MAGWTVATVIVAVILVIAIIAALWIAIAALSRVNQLQACCDKRCPHETINSNDGTGQTIISNGSMMHNMDCITTATDVSCLECKDPTVTTLVSSESQISRTPSDHHTSQNFASSERPRMRDVEVSEITLKSSVRSEPQGNNAQPSIFVIDENGIVGTPSYGMMAPDTQGFPINITEAEVDDGQIMIKVANPDISGIYRFVFGSQEPGWDRLNEAQAAKFRTNLPNPVTIREDELPENFSCQPGTLSREFYRNEPIYRCQYQGEVGICMGTKSSQSFRYMPDNIVNFKATNDGKIIYVDTKGDILRHQIGTKTREVIGSVPIEGRRIVMSSYGPNCYIFSTPHHPMVDLASESRPTIVLPPPQPIKKMIDLSITETEKENGKITLTTPVSIMLSDDDDPESGTDTW
jgi:hypothetical protein